MNTEIVKVTIKSKKETMVQALRDCLDLVGQHDADLAKEVQFTLDNADTASKTDIFDVVQHVQALLSTLNNVGFEQPTLFDDEEDVADDNKKNSTAEEKKKPALKGKGKSSTEKPTTSKTKKTSGTAENLKKPSGKKSKEKVETINQISGLPVVKLFPETLEIKVDADTGEKIILKRADKLTNYKEVALACQKYFNKGKAVYFATYWTKRLLREFEYAYVNRVAEELCENGFPFDLDILEAKDACKFVQRFWAMSIYTDAMFSFDAKDIEYVTDKNPYTGEEFKVRVSNGMEFEIYLPVEEEPEEEQD